MVKLGAKSGDLGERVVVLDFLSELKQRECIVIARLKLMKETDLGFEPRFFSSESSSLAIVGPKLGLIGEICKFLNPTSLGRQVKATPGGNRASFSFPQVGFGFHVGLRSLGLP